MALAGEKKKGQNDCWRIFSNPMLLNCNFYRLNSQEEQINHHGTNSYYPEMDKLQQKGRIT